MSLPPEGGSHRIVKRALVASTFRWKSGANHLIGERPELAPRHQSRIEIPHRPRGHVARIGVERLPFLLAFAIDPLEVRPWEEHLAADLNPARHRFFQRERNPPDRP